MRTLAELFNSADDDGILVADSCIFKPTEPFIGVVIDMTSELVFEENQVDTVIFNHQDQMGSAEGTIVPYQFLGMGMIRDLIILGRGPFTGVIHQQMEVINFNFGEEDNMLYINETTEAVHVVNLDSTDKASNDLVFVYNLSGPMLING